MVLGGATDGEAETVPESAKVAGRMAAIMRENDTPITSKVSRALLLDFKCKPNRLGPVGIYAL